MILAVWIASAASARLVSVKIAELTVEMELEREVSADSARVTSELIAVFTVVIADVLAAVSNDIKPLRVDSAPVARLISLERLVVRVASMPCARLVSVDSAECTEVIAVPRVEASDEMAFV